MNKAYDKKLGCITEHEPDRVKPNKNWLSG